MADTVTYNFIDDWYNWPGITTGDSSTDVVRSNPDVTGMDVTVTDGWLTKVQIHIAAGTARLLYDSLFINTSYNGPNTTTNLTDTNWDKWNYFVRDGYGTGHADQTDGTEAGNGFYSVTDGYNYTLAIDQPLDVRASNPNGIEDANSKLELIDNMYAVTPNEYLDKYSVVFSSGTISYTFGTGLELNGGFFVAYSPWCANDVMGGGTPVPEPATMLLFGTGLLGLAGVARKRNRK